MTYTKQIREYCLNNQGAVLDVSLAGTGAFFNDIRRIWNNGYYIIGEYYLYFSL